MAIFKNKNKTDESTGTPPDATPAPADTAPPSAAPPAPKKPRPKPDTYTYVLLVALIALIVSAVYLFLSVKYFKDTQHKPLAHHSAVFGDDEGLSTGDPV